MRLSATWRHPSSVIIVAIAINAALYAAGSYTTAYIPSPWGVGQFRPAVVIPALFSVVFGPWAGGVGAALGTLIADSIKHGAIYPGSLFASVPGNFVGFFLMGYLFKKKFNWATFITVSNITLVIANAITAFLYVFVYKYLYTQTSTFIDSSTGSLITLSLGLTIFWFATMLPFVLLVVPPMIAAVTKAFPSIVAPEIKSNGVQPVQKRLIGTAMLVPGIIMIMLGVAVTYFELGGYWSTGLTASYLGESSLSMIQVLLYAGGVVLTALGGFLALKKDTGSKVYR